MHNVLQLEAESYLHPTCTISAPRCALIVCLIYERLT